MFQELIDTLGPDVWFFAVLAVALCVAGWTDFRTEKIYNWLTYPAILIGLIGHGIVGGSPWSTGLTAHSGVMDLTDSLAGLAVGFLPMFLAWQAGGIGGGDAKVMAAVGALAGWRFALTAMFYGLGVSVVYALLVLLRRKMVRDTMGRVFRFMWLALLKNNPGDPATDESPKIPFGFCLCVGAGIVLLLILLYGPETRMLWIA
jgi:prepilin peptidase CpaA